MNRRASISRCGRYRYSLTRSWGTGSPFVLFIGLNPSTADHQVDDPTIRRCIAFADAWGYRALAVANLFAFRATDPKELRRAVDPIGPRNNATLARLVRSADRIIAAWGNHGTYCDRGEMVRRQIRRTVYHLGLTQHGHPRHPLYVAGGTEPTRWGR